MCKIWAAFDVIGKMTLFFEILLWHHGDVVINSKLIYKKKFVNCNANAKFDVRMTFGLKDTR